jgi:hypothetical protein
MRYLTSLLIAFSLFFAAPVHSAEWVEVFNPKQVLTLNLKMEPEHWDVIRHDTTNKIKHPAYFWADGDDTQLLVSVRRKSSRALPSEANPIKVSLKIDINDYVDGQMWRSLRKLSLENGGDKDPISEGLAWNFHELATGPGFYPTGYHPGLAAWIRLVVNGVTIGVYTSVTQRDSQFLRNRQLPRGTTSAGVRRSWTYKMGDRNGYELEDGDLPHGPTWEALCYAPFTVGNKKNPPCPTPDDATLETQLNDLIDMPAMLTQGAVDAFSSNGDALFTHEKNFFHIDFNPALAVNAGRKRLYLMWDLDAVPGGDISANIYGQKKGNKFAQTPYQEVILNHPKFRAQYNAIMMGLLDPVSGPLSENALHGFLNDVEAVVTPALVEDPHAGFGSEAAVAEHFANLRNWVSQRIINVLGQVN